MSLNLSVQPPNETNISKWIVHPPATNSQVAVFIPTVPPQVDQTSYISTALDANNLAFATFFLLSMTLLLLLHKHPRGAPPTFFFNQFILSLLALPPLVSVQWIFGKQFFKKAIHDAMRSTMKIASLPKFRPDDILSNLRDHFILVFLIFLLMRSMVQEYTKSFIQGRLNKIRSPLVKDVLLSSLIPALTLATMEQVFFCRKLHWAREMIEHIPIMVFIGVPPRVNILLIQLSLHAFLGAPMQVAAQLQLSAATAYLTTHFGSPIAYQAGMHELSDKNRALIDTVLIRSLFECYWVAAAVAIVWGIKSVYIVLIFLLDTIAVVTTFASGWQVCQAVLDTERNARINLQR